MKEGINVLLVCTGNTFRSFIAENCLKKYLLDNKIDRINVSSAGILAKRASPNPKTISELKRRGVKIKNYKQRKLTKGILEKQDFVIAMAKNHQDFILKNFKRSVPLFNEVVYNKHTSISDGSILGERIKDKKIVGKFIEETVDYINSSIGKLAEQIIFRNFFFVDLINNRTKQKNSFPFIPLHETKHSIAFMSIDIPKHENGHILVIPKKRYKSLEEIPKNIKTDIMETVSMIGKAIKKNHDGYNILLNSGNSAGQYIIHTHFHIIPRKKDDEIKIEVWKHKNLTKSEFMRDNNQLKEAIKEIKRGN